MTNDYDPFVYADTSCGSELEFASWHLTQGVTAVRPNGSLAFAHTAHILRTCLGRAPSNTSRGTGAWRTCPEPLAWCGRRRATTVV